MFHARHCSVKLLPRMCNGKNPELLHLRLFQVLTNSFQANTAPVSSSSLSEELNVLSSSKKLRIDQFRLTRIGMKPSYVNAIRDFTVTDTLTDEELLYIRIYHSIVVEKYAMNIYRKKPTEAISVVADENPCLVQVLLERNKRLRTIAARIYAPPGHPIGYLYDLEGVYRTAIIKNESGKCIFQLLTNNPTGWVRDAKIFSANGKLRLGHIRKLEGSNWNLNNTMLYLRISEGLDVTSKCCLISAALFLMSYDYVR